MKALIYYYNHINIHPRRSAIYS